MGFFWSHGSRVAMMLCDPGKLGILVVINAEHYLWTSLKFGLAMSPKADVFCIATTTRARHTLWRASFSSKQFG